MKLLLYCLVLLSFVFSCNQKTKNNPLIFQSVDSLTINNWIINSKHDTVLYTNRKNKLFIPKLVFVNKKGEKVYGSIRVVFYEIQNDLDFLLNNYCTVTDKERILESDGVVKIVGYDLNGELLMIDNNSVINYYSICKKFISNSYFFERLEDKWVEKTSSENNAHSSIVKDFFFENDTLRPFNFKYTSDQRKIFFNEKLKRSDLFTKEFFQRLWHFYGDEEIIKVYLDNIDLDLKSADSLVLIKLQKRDFYVNNFLKLADSFKLIFIKTNYSNLESFNNNENELKRLSQLYNTIGSYNLLEKKQLNHTILGILVGYISEEELNETLRNSKIYTYISKVVKTNIDYNIDSYISNIKVVNIKINKSDNLNGIMFIRSRKRKIIIPVNFNKGIVRINVPNDEDLEFVYLDSSFKNDSMIYFYNQMLSKNKFEYDIKINVTQTTKEKLINIL